MKEDFAHRPPSGAAQGLHWLGLVFPPLLALDIWLIGQGPAWQGWVALGATLIGLLFVAGAAFAVRRDRVKLAGGLALAGVTVALLAHQLVVGGLIAPITLVGAFAVLSLGRLSFPHRRRMHLIASLLFVAILCAAELWQPLRRQTVTQNLDTGVLVATGAIVLLALVAWLLLRIARAGSMQARLAISYSLMALLPVALLGSTALNQAYQTQRERATAQLELAAARKESAIQLWIEQLWSDLDNILAGGELSRRAIALLDADEPSLRVADTTALHDRFREIMGRSGRLDQIFLLDQYGRVVISTDSDQEGNAYNNEIFFQMGRLAPYIQAPYTTPAAEHRLITLVMPVKSANGDTIGVLGGRADLSVLNRIMAEPGRLGTTGETYLVGRNQRLLNEPTAGMQKGEYVTTVAVRTALEEKTGGQGLYVNHRGERVIGVFRWLPELRVVLLAEQARSQAFRPLYTTLATVAGVTVVALVLAALVAVVSARAIARPLTELADTATQIAAGDLALTAREERRDEIGLLSAAFNKMTGQLRALIAGLEERVAARTRELEERSRYLEAAALVGSAAASVLESDPLIRRVVDLIRDQFDLYYVGLFLVDEGGRWAVLKAGTGKAGRRMLARRHRIPVGEGMIGWSIEHSLVRLADDAIDDSVRLWIDELPETRSEAAIPLRVRGRTIGALTVQDRRPHAFDDTLLAALQMMGDQIAVALENARLFSETQTALEAAQRAYGDLTGQAWGELLRLQPGIGFRASRHGTAGADSPMEQRSPEGAGNALSLPIQVRGHLIGTLETHKSTAWSREEIAFLNRVVDQLAGALDNARLFEDTQRRAAREHLAREISEKLRSLTDVEAIATAAADELGRVLGTDTSFVAIQVGEPANGNGHNPERPAESER